MTAGSYRRPINPYSRRVLDPVATQAIDRMLGTYVGTRPECPLCLGTGHGPRTLADNLSDGIREKAEAIASSYAYSTRYRLIASTLLLAGIPVTRPQRSALAARGSIRSSTARPRRPGRPGPQS